LGILEEDPETALRKDRQLHRRYTLHGVSHMLGLDCTTVRTPVTRSTWVISPRLRAHVEPGLYFQPNDLTVPAEYRGIGVRIEDDVLVTKDGAKNLSEALPREPHAIEDWMTELWSTTTPHLALRSRPFRERERPMTTSRRRKLGLARTRSDGGEPGATSVRDGHHAVVFDVNRGSVTALGGQRHRRGTSLEDFVAVFRRLGPSG